MGKLVVLEIGVGDFERGFPVTLQIGDDASLSFIKVTGRLPANPEILEQYTRWKKAYYSLPLYSRITITPIEVTNVSFVHIEKDLYLLNDSLNNWLASREFLPVKEALLMALSPKDEIRVLIQTENSELHKLPWHIWNFFDSYPKAEVALSSSVYRHVENVKSIGKRNFKNRVKILGIFGNNVGLDLGQDLDLLRKLPNAEVCFLVEPKRQQINDRLWEQDWDILFFAGHSYSQADDKTGYIQINENDNLMISDLKYGLRKAIERGLQLAIFNSCDGLGLARNLADLNIPQVIVLREPVPDLVAQKFLKDFLDAFSRGKSLYLAVREARERLQGLEDEFPCASWLPIIYQNPVVVPLTWVKQPAKRKFGKVLFTTIGVSALLITPLITKTLDKIILPPEAYAQIKYQQSQISSGEEILVTSVTNTIDKKKGVQAFAYKNFETARKYFQKSLELNRNDPETLIYLNNAKIGNSSALKIAVSVPINNTPGIAQEILRGVAQAQNEVNSNGGINGKLLQVEIANDDNNPETAKQIATELVKDSNILAVVGHSSSDVSIAAAPVYQEGGLVMISPTNSSQEISGISKYIFRISPNSSVMSATLANYVIRKTRKNVAICADSSSVYGISFAQEFSFAIISAGGKVENIDCNLSASNLNPSEAISQAINNHVDGLLLSPSFHSIDKALEVANANEGRLALFGSDALYSSETLQSGQGSVKGLVLVVPSQSANTFVENATKLWGGTVNWRTAMAYDATQVILKGLKQSNNRESSPGFSASGATGNIQFLPSGDRKRPATLLKVAPNNESNNSYEFVPVSDVNRMTNASDNS
jgi:branched-chain amino acid transport system substrate-binding protein